MARARKAATPAAQSIPRALFAPLPAKCRRVLIIPRLLEKMAGEHRFRGEEQDRAYRIIQKWADLEKDGRLARKETTLDADFLLEVFGQALGYRSSSAGEKDWDLERQFSVPGIGAADGALGYFSAGQPARPIAVIELKGADTNLDTDRSNGRTPVQQCWDYLNALPEATWGIVSNFTEIRLYNKTMGNQAYEVFTLQQLRDPVECRKFWCLFDRGGLLTSSMGRLPRAQWLLTESGERQRQVGDELYNYYSDQRARLIEHLRRDHGQALDTAIHIAQKLFDRIIFVAFCQDRGFLHKNAIKRSYETVPPFFRVTNPRWQNFLALFHIVDKGSPQTELAHGYNGGLFAHDPEVDDLQLEDDWTDVFFEIGKYDFKDEVNVDVLGHIFERSITELEKMRVAGVFGPDTAPGPSPKMQKSAERKRFGIYYTPPEFTRFIVHSTVGELLNQRFENLKKAHEIKPEDEDSRQPQPRVAAYYQQALSTLRNFKIVDPACGSGAFLIAAYDLLEDYYTDVIRNLAAQGVPEAEELFARFRDIIVTENLYGVDLSEQAVEITRLALWIKTVRYDKTLADLSRNIIWGNSLVDDNLAHPQAMKWPEHFPETFDAAKRPFGAGFDAVIGNPPWERLKVQEREFFAFSAPEIAGAVNAASRRKLIEKLSAKSPELFQRYEMTQKAAERILDYARQSGRYPLTGRGDINTYMLFAELARSLVAPHGRAGLLAPSGIATDNTTREFFADLVENESLIKLYDFENKEGIFQDVHRAFKFCTLIFGGSAIKTSEADFAFFIHNMDELDQRDRHITLSQKDIALLNPNTRTCPIFRTRRDGEITKAIYRRIPILVDQARKEGGNPWEIRFLRMFDQTNDAELFADGAQLKKDGFKLDGNVWNKGKQVYLPLYEAKMIQAYDHRAAGVVVQADNWMRQGQTEAASLVEHQNPEFAALPRWWVKEDAVIRLLTPGDPAALALKDVTSPTNQRTMIAAFIPRVGVVNSAPLLLVGDGAAPRQQCCLLANLNSFAYDFVARQKVGGVHLNFFIVEQLPTLSPDVYAERCPWDKNQTLEKWISERVLKLTCTANDMIPLAEAAGFKEKVHKWKDAERAELRAELDAAYFHLYGISRDDAIYILSTFQATGSPADPHSPAALVMEKYDELTEA